MSNSEFKVGDLVLDTSVKICACVYCVVDEHYGIITDIGTKGVRIVGCSTGYGVNREKKYIVRMFDNCNSKLPRWF